jgi:glutamate dehydrogenase
LPEGPNPALLAALIARLRAGVLPGDEAMTDGELADAARFVLDAAALRRPGQCAIALGTVIAPGRPRLMRLAVINEDMPFLVDSVGAALSARGLAIDRLLHPVISVVRDEAHRLMALPGPDGEQARHWPQTGAYGTGPDGEGARESLIYIETPRADARTRAALAAELEVVLGDVRAAVGDWAAMRRALARDAERLDRLGEGDGAALLRWFESGRLTQLGHVLHRRNGRQEAVLGICRESTPRLLSPTGVEAAFQWFADRPPGAALPLVLKSDHPSLVHRRAALDLFAVPVVDGGEPVALSIHAGLWTSAALAAAPDTVPRIAGRMGALLARYGFDPAGHGGKKLVHALTRLPHDLLVGFADADLERVAMAMTSLLDRPRPRLVIVPAPLGRHAFAFVWLPRDMVGSGTHGAIAEMLAGAMGASVRDWSLAVEGGTLAQLLFMLDLRGGAGREAVAWDEAGLDARLQALVRGWPAEVEAELARTMEPARAAALAARHAEAFPPGYRAAYGAGEAAVDIGRLRALGANRTAVRLYSLAGDEAGLVRLKLYECGGGLALSDAVPALENFGFRVLDTFPTAVAGLGAIHDFLLAPPSAGVLDRAAAIGEALGAVLNGAAEDDRFNSLVTAVGLEAGEAGWLRAWHRWLRQAGLGLAMGTAVAALAGAPGVARGLVALFRAKHAPDGGGEAQAAAALTAIGEGLANVPAINDDRQLRAFLAVVQAIVRTNAFTPGGAEALAFKLDPAQVPGLPKPVPWREIFVSSSRVEGVHLRAGPIARGGIRWSDRRDDFRTEVLGLMKAQRVKNAVIVPTGAKGGFFPKRLPADRAARAAEGLESYRVFIRALLSLTDNLVDGEVVHPEGVRVLDGDDPYLVVAADKGTAAFSDEANAIAVARGFWLGDAFASGGSHGYDHKAMGITARGAWIPVSRQFSEMGVDIAREPVTVAGVGDMSGDVFGNGMLLSKALKLVAAFDHRHIFLDPDPDPARAWGERARLFAMPGSSWDDYDRALISAGGGVFPRDLKTIALTAEVRALLAIEGESSDPESLIRAILAAPIDLLWFGGIGTYVRAAGEADGAVGDPANDAVRIDGQRVRARVVGEGANLAFTQAGRIEFALSGGPEGEGGRIDTDFIDNSAGVDCSDKEVNIKIALSGAMRAGRLDEAARDALLKEMTDDVAALVLEDNRLQALALSIAETGGAAALPAQARVIELLEDLGQLDRRGEGLADGAALARRVAEGRGLTRPELAVLLSTAKLAVQHELERSAVPADPGLAGELLAAFPAAMQAAFREDILAHRLGPQIIATRIANRLVNRLGFVYPFELAEEEGASLADVAGAFVAAESLFGMEATWAAIEAAAMPEPVRLQLLAISAYGLRLQVAELLRVGNGNGGVSRPSGLASALAGGVGALAAGAADLLAGEALAQSQRGLAEFRAAGAPDAVTAGVARLFELDGAVGLAALGEASGMPVLALARAFVTLGIALGLDWAQAAAVRLRASDPWERLLVAGLARDFQQMRLDFLRRVLRVARSGDRAPGSDPGAAVREWLERHAEGVQRLRARIDRVRPDPAPSPAMLAQIASQGRALLAK